MWRCIDPIHNFHGGRYPSCELGIKEDVPFQRRFVARAYFEHSPFCCIYCIIMMIVVVSSPECRFSIDEFILVSITAIRRMKVIIINIIIVVV